MGNTTPINVKAGKFQSVGNPYAAEVDIRKIHSTGIVTDIIIWDPTLTIGSQFGLGAYQTLYKNGTNYVNLFPSAAYGPAGTVNNNIKSGQYLIGIIEIAIIQYIALNALEDFKRR